MPQDPPLPLLFSRADALDLGLSRHQVTQRVASGAWTSLRHGRYAVTARLEALPSREQHLVGVAALLSSRAGPDAASHLSAAAALGWILPLDGPGAPTVTSQSGSGPTRRRHGVVVQVAGLDGRDTTVVDLELDGERLALRCTSPARTLADLLRHLPVPDSVALADDALRRGAVDPQRVEGVLRRQEGWPYAARARRASALVDPRRESWLESYSFAVLAMAGLPLPEPQVEIRDARRRFVGRVDGWWDDTATALEPDGRAKYLARLGPLPSDLDAAADDVARHVRGALLRQNERERRLQDLGVVVVRWSTDDVVRRPQLVVARAGRARHLGDRSRFTGVVVRRGAPLFAPSEPLAGAS